MSIDSQIKVLFDRWRELRAQGLNLSAEEICHDCPELADGLREVMGNNPTSSWEPNTASSDTRAAVTVNLANSEFPFLEAPQGPGELGRLSTFRILRVLGQGGMGIVFEGEDSALRRRVAVKVLRPEIHSPLLEQRFQQEARLAASLNHDHIVTIYQIGQHGDRPFLVMEYLIGESLAQRLERDGWLPATEALEITRQAALGLAVAHERGLIHRDIKPANIWLESDHPGGKLKRVKILDFGLARTIVSHNTLSNTGELVGTPSFMAPEQIFGRPLDGRTDLYSLGCTLYACLMGTPPFVKDDTTALLEAVAFEKTPDLEKLNPRMPRSVAILLTELLAKDPDARPANAGIVAARLNALETADAMAVPGTSRTQLLKVSSPRLEPRIPHLHTGVWIGGATILAAALIALVMGIRGFGSDPAGGSSEAEGAQGTAAVVPTGPEIKIGVLYSLSGTFAGSERPMADAILLAVEEINNSGGVLGRTIKPVVVDAHSDAEVTAQEAEKLLTTEKIVTLFGCGSSSGRKLVVPVCARHDNLLMYSALYEGLEQSPYVIYVGGAPNQQIQPTAGYAFTELHKRKFFLVGSDYVYSHAANEILSDQLTKLTATVVGTAYEPLGGSDFGLIVKQIVDSKADIVMNTIDGSSNTAFFQAMRRAGIQPDQVPIMWLSVGEEDLASIPQQELTGDYISLPYFQSIESPQNEAFLKRFRARYPTRRADDAAEAAYSAVYLWKQAVLKADSVDPPRIREAMRDQRFDAPEGLIRIDPVNLHAWRIARIARIDAGRNFEIVFTSPKPLAPEPFPSSRNREAWEAYLKKLSDGWGQRWEGPRR
jgi:serine/threonine protein kinase/ABC-type branched-subunit amino acid transport system substrate-binding protein